MPSWTKRLKWEPMSSSRPRLVRSDSTGLEVGSDKVILPPEVLADISHKTWIKFPLFFELRNPATSTRTYSGVLEFSAPEGTVLLPDKVIASLNATSTPEVVLRYADLPKATFVQFQPLTADFLDIPDHKAVMESVMRRRFATLTKGDIIGLSFGGNTYNIAVVDVKPLRGGHTAVNLIDTDCAVDFLPPLNMGKGGSRQPSTVLTLDGESVSGSVARGSTATFKFFVSDQAAAGVAGGAVVVEATSTDGDADVYVGPHPLVMQPTQTHHAWAGNTVGDVAVRVPAADPLFRPGWFSVGVTGFQADASFTLRVRSEPESKSDEISAGTTAGEPSDASDQPKQPGQEQCSNCGDFVPSARFAMHSAFCARHNMRCKVEGCGAIVHVSEKDKHWHCPVCSLVMHADHGAKHTALYHTVQTCECGFDGDMLAMRAHRTTACARRLVVCRFCGNTSAAGSPPTDAADRLAGLTGHEAYCGSRTSGCVLCGAAVQLKRADIHKRAHDAGIIALRLDRGQAVAAADAAAAAAASAAAAAAARGDTGDGSTDAADVLAAGGWACEACTLANPATARACSACGAAAPPGIAPAPEVNPADVGGLPSWQCPTCTYANEEDATQCAMCATKRHGADDSAKGRVPARPAYTSRLAARPRCANVACSAVASAKGEAQELRLCSRCYRAIVQPHEAESAMTTALVARYFAQLSKGCEFGATCKNPNCKHGAANGAPGSADRGAVGPKEMAMIAITLAKEGTEQPPTFYWCVPGTVAVDAAAVSTSAVRSDATSSGAGAGAGAGAVARAGSPDTDVTMEPAAAAARADTNDDGGATVQGGQQAGNAVAPGQPDGTAAGGATSAATKRRQAREERRQKKARRDEAAKSRIAGAFFG